MSKVVGGYYMVTLGIDLGNYNIKTSSEVIFPSKITTKENLLETQEY